ncbi:MAG TPA: type II toxin-antitoxin system VapC family toxin [Thermoanaerobaculia bacterium]|nr:type II toxin-antitoxin system VapC family toxin [Thermoanaerobaculia bacterium]
MTLRYLLDTNVLSEPVKPVPNAGVLIRIRQHWEELATAAPVWHELWFGCRRLPSSTRRTKLEEYLGKSLAPSLKRLPYDDHAAERHAEERARLVSLGKTPSFTDGQIAAIAMVHGLIVVTRNIDHFVAFQGLVVQNWSE